MKLRVGSYPDEVWILPTFGSAPIEGAEAISPANALYSLDAWLDSGAGREALDGLSTLLGLPLIVDPRSFTPWVRERIREAFARGELRAYRTRVLLSGAPVAPSIEPRKPEPTPTKEEKTFVIIELMDDANPPQPVAFEKYRIELPDYSVREGMLDQNGRAEISGIDPGQCKVTFPNLLREDWWLSGSAG